MTSWKLSLFKSKSWSITKEVEGAKSTQSAKNHNLPNMGEPVRSARGVENGTRLLLIVNDGIPVSIHTYLQFEWLKCEFVAVRRRRNRKNRN